ncbi:MAG: extracellular solute-binding protein [bacterium]
MNWFKIIFTTGVIFVAVILIAGFGCKASDTSGGAAVSNEKIELNYWRLWDDSAVFTDIIKAYESEHPNITIKYKKLDQNEYEEEVLSALASGQGPDMWSIHNTWMPRHVDKLAPLPEKSMVSYTTQKSGCKEVKVPTTATQMTVNEYKNTFPEVAQDDFLATIDTKDEEGSAIQKEVIMGIPLSIDTLALYYNKDLFNSAVIARPPTTWEEFMDFVQELTETDRDGNITKSGAALGTASNLNGGENINRAVDILSLLMLQTGTQMVNDTKTAATFNQSLEDNNGEKHYSGLEALRFYTDFANSRKTVYTWTPRMDHSIDSFTSGKVAMMLNYSYQDAAIKDKAPNLNYGIAQVPQPKDASFDVNFANYWGEVVSKNSEHVTEAWDFLQYLGEAENSKIYVESTNRPAAHRDLIEAQKDDAFLGAFAKQTLSAKSWYQIDPESIEVIFKEMIDSVVLAEKEPDQAINDAATQVTVLMRSSE